MTKVRGNFTDFIDFSRASSATYMGSDGLIKTAATNEPRVEYDANGNVKGLLIEEARTNFITYSEDFSAWILTNSTVSSNSEVAPDGSSTADTISFSSVDGLCRFIGTSCSVGETYTNSVWLKAGTATSIKLVILFSGGGLGLTSSTLSLTNDWQRFDITATVPAGTPDTARLRLQSTEIGTVHAWGAQLEAGSFATSYIPTNGSTATRAADIASISVDNFGYNQKAGTVVVEVDLPNLGNTGSGSEGIASFVANAAVENVGLYKKGFSTASQVRYEVRSSNASQATIDLTVPQQNSKMAYSFAADRFNLCVDGGLGTEDTSGNVPSGVTDLSLGNIYSVSGSNFLNGHIKSLKYIPRRNSNTQLQEFTS